MFNLNLGFGRALSFVGAVIVQFYAIYESANVLTDVDGVTSLPATGTGEPFNTWFYNVGYLNPQVDVDGFIDFSGPKVMASLLNDDYAVATFQNYTEISSTVVCTGLDRDTTNNNWLVGDDGRLRTGANCGHVVRYSDDFSTILGEYPISGVGGLFSGTWSSVQGVAYRPVNDSIWVCDKGLKTLRNITNTGADTGNSISLLYEPNGLAYDSNRDALIVSADSGATELISCTTLLVIDSFSLNTGVDQLTYDPSTEVLYASIGNNGVDGSVHCYDLYTNYSTVKTVALDSNSQAVEGISIDNGVLTVMNDGGYHADGLIDLNIACRYSFVPLKRKKSRKFGLKVEYKGAAQGATVSMLTSGYPYSTGTSNYGWGLNITSTNPHEIELVFKDRTSVDKLVFTSPAVTDNTGINTFDCVIDMDAETIVANQNGSPVTMTQVGLFTDFVSQVELQRLNMAYARDNNPAFRFDGAIGYLEIGEELTV